MIVSFGHTDISLAVEPHLVRRVHLSVRRRTAVAGVSGLSGTRDNGNHLCAEIEPHHSMASKVCPIECSIRTDHETEGIVGGITCSAGPQQRGDSRGSSLRTKSERGGEAQKFTACSHSGIL